MATTPALEKDTVDRCYHLVFSTSYCHTSISLRLSRKILTLIQQRTVRTVRVCVAIDEMKLSRVIQSMT